MRDLISIQCVSSLADCLAHSVFKFVLFFRGFFMFYIDFDQIQPTIDFYCIISGLVWFGLVDFQYIHCASAFSFSHFMHCIHFIIPNRLYQFSMFLGKNWVAFLHSCTWLCVLNFEWLPRWYRQFIAWWMNCFVHLSNRFWFICKKKKHTHTHVVNIRGLSLSSIVVSCFRLFHSACSSMWNSLSKLPMDW